MSRPIKFRAGRNLGNGFEMTKPFDFKQYVKYHEEAQQNLLPFVGDDVVFMQYTGLKDKNGTEIYEGDIINNAWDPGISPTKIVFEQGQFTPEGQYAEDAAIVMEDSEVIGNIYESKELLDE